MLIAGKSALVIDINSLLLEGEQFIGTYSVEIARWNGDRWTATVPPLYASLTDQRLILHPQTRRRYEPAIIPRSTIRRVAELDSVYRRGVVIYLRDGTPLTIFAAGNQGETFMNHLFAAHRVTRTVAQTPPQFAPCPVEFETNVEIDRLRRLIACVEQI